MTEQQTLNSGKNLLNESDIEVEEQNLLQTFRGASIEMEFTLDDEDLVNASIIAYTIDLIQQ